MERPGGRRENKKKQLVVGILAHVDAGKTTLSEAMLYTAGAIRRLGRVDHADAFLDTFALERQRGITIFSKEARLSLPEAEITLLDTPGHVDFSAEMERTLQVLDCAVLVVSGADGVQAHTRTLWRLLERLSVPTFLFLNKMDLPGPSRAALLEDLRRQLGGGFVDFGAPPEAVWEEAALCDEEALEDFLETGKLSDETLTALIRRRQVFPCCFGAALHLEGVEALLEGLGRYAPVPSYGSAFSAKVYKIARDAQGKRLTYMKITGGSLRVKDVLTGGEGDAAWSEKADQLRLCSGAKFQAVEEVTAGTVCAVAGLQHTLPGMGLGAEEASRAPVLEPALSYRVLLPEGADVHTALGKLRQLEEEDPQLRIRFHERLQAIDIQLMGQVQMEVLQQLILERFGLAVAFGPGSIVYRETIAAPAIGIGHYEPLRHYAEVHLLLEPLERGGGLRFATACSEDRLDRNWQRLILTHLMEKPHLGVLTGAPITDMRITLLTGRAHLKHTEGGDFRQATYRAVRQGLMGAESVLLEPWYHFRLEVPASAVGKAMSDLQRMEARFEGPETEGAMSVLTGTAPVAAMGDYWREVAAYTRGAGRLSCGSAGYEICHNAQEVIEAMGYQPERDMDNPPDSVFCDHGAGFVVKWDEVPARAHLDSSLGLDRPQESQPPREAVPRQRPAAPYPASREEEKALQAIFERTYGEVRRRSFQPTPKAPPAPPQKRTVPPAPAGPEYLLVDGYNIIFAWEELKAMAARDLEAARLMLMDLMCNYQGFRKCEVILVFDAYRVKGSPGSVERWRNIHVVYTKEAETADTYIERATYQIAKHHRVRVATSDSLEQLIILGHGAVRLSARDLREELERADGQIASIIERNNMEARAFRQLRHQLKK